MAVKINEHTRKFKKQYWPITYELFLPEEEKERILHIIIDEFNFCFGFDNKASFFGCYFYHDPLCSPVYSPQMFCELMDYYTLSKAEAAMVLGATPAKFRFLLAQRTKFTCVISIKMGFAHIILILGTKKYGSTRMFLKWLKYYFTKHHIIAPFHNSQYLVLIDALRFPAKV